MYVAFGLGVAAQATLSKGAAGNFTSVTIAWGIGVMLGMHVGGGVSHSHMNPAITLALACVGVFPWRKVPGYVVSQTLGAFTASLMVYVMFYSFSTSPTPCRPRQRPQSSTRTRTHP
jgi:glycerol uptake facilitator-like aquaporin